MKKTKSSKKIVLKIAMSMTEPTDPSSLLAGVLEHGNDLADQGECHELAFFMFFSPYFSLILTIFIRPDLILSTPLHLFHTISPAHSVHR